MPERKDDRPPWKRKKPKEASKPMTAGQKQEARTRAAKAGRPYPNLVDNMAVARKKGKKKSAAAAKKK